MQIESKKLVLSQEQKVGPNIVRNINKRYKAIISLIFNPLKTKPNRSFQVILQEYQVGVSNHQLRKNFYENLTGEERRKDLGNFWLRRT